MTKHAVFIRSTALAAVLGLPLALTPAAAQQNTTAQDQQSTTAQDQTMEEKIQQADAPDTGETDTALTEAMENQDGATQGAGGSDPVIVTVGDAQILNSDMMRAIGMLPPAMRQQPPEMLLPAALQQLVLRELILDRARSENLAKDPEFAMVAEQASAEAQENATVQFWLQREMGNAISDEAVNTAYEQIKQNAQGEVPPLETVRPQIEQELQRREMARIQNDLRANGPEIAFPGQNQPITSYADDSFCTGSYEPGGDAAAQSGSEFAEMDLDGDGMVSQEEYRQCRTAAAQN